MSCYNEMKYYSKLEKQFSKKRIPINYDFLYTYYLSVASEFTRKGPIRLFLFESKSPFEELVDSLRSKEISKEEFARIRAAKAENYFYNQKNSNSFNRIDICDGFFEEMNKSPYMVLSDKDNNRTNLNLAEGIYVNFSDFFKSLLDTIVRVLPTPDRITFSNKENPNVQLELRTIINEAYSMVKRYGAYTVGVDFTSEELEHHDFYNEIAGVKDYGKLDTGHSKGIYVREDVLKGFMSSFKINIYGYVKPDSNTTNNTK